MISTLLLSWKHNYTWHHTHYIWHHSHCICAATHTVSIDHNSFGSYRTWHTYDIIHTLHDITITLSTSLLSIYDITATAFMTSDTLHMTSPPGFMTSHPLSQWHHRHYLCEYISTIFNIKHTGQRQYSPYIWNHSLHMCIHVITHTVSMI